MIGVLSSLRSPAGQADPHPLYARLRALGSVIPAPWGGYLLTTYDVCERVLRGREWGVPDAHWRANQGPSARWDASSAREMAATLASLNPPDHTTMRRFLGNVFDRDTVARLRPSTQRIVDRSLRRLVERIRSDGSADFVSLVSDEIPISVVGEWLSLPKSDYSTLSRLTHEQAFAQELLPTKGQLAISDAATIGLRNYFTALVKHRRRKPGDDLVSGWIERWSATEPDDEVTDRTIYRLVMFIVMAALETTSTLLSTALWLLSTSPRAWQTLAADHSRIPAAVEEVLRYDPPIHVVSRIANADTQLADRELRRGDLLHVLTASANNDPDRYDAPEIFDIERGGPNLSFGGGVHHCLGAPLARMEASVLVETLVSRYPTLRTTAPPEWAQRVVFRRISALPVTA